LVSHAKTCLTDDIESVDFVACSAQFLTASLMEALEYRRKLLPALKAVLSEEGGAETSSSKYDLFCWITENDVVFSQLQEAFDSLVELVVGLNNDSDRMLTEGGSLRQECACRSVELATTLLQAVYQRVQWCGQSCPPELNSCFTELRTHLISAVAWSIDRPEAGLDLAIRFSDKDLMLEISEHLDKQAAASGGKPHSNFMTALTRSNPDIQLADYALQWFYKHSERARLQSLLLALHERESGSLEPSVEQKRPLSSVSPSRKSTAKRSRKSRSPSVTAATDSCVSRFLQRTEARDFAWLHQLGNRDYNQASKGLLSAGENEINSLGRRRTLLSLSKLSGIASGHYQPFIMTTHEPQDAGIPLVDKYLEVINFHEELIRRGQLNSDEVLPSHALASQYIADITKVDSAEIDEDLLMKFSAALRLAQLYTELDEDHLSFEARREKQEKLLSRIWTQAINVDYLNKKPDETDDFNEACVSSFFYALLTTCLQSDDLSEKLIPSLPDVLSSISSDKEPWLRILAENAYNLATKHNDFRVTQSTQESTPMEI
uniref:Nucleoporin_C domain-containing protein n=1 Tax=Rodentolepis nana TaxID=102285 RepID=A0A0R3TBC6_RODNA